MIRVLVVDDSPLMRRVISRMLGKDDLVTVIGTAEDGEEALEKIEALKPDVVTMDIEMPRMNGLEALKAIMARAPLPVIMLSAATKEGADITLDALNMGACDFMPKDFPEGALDLGRIGGELRRKVKAVARRHAGAFVLSHGDSKQPLSFTSENSSSRSVLAMGASTGGPPVLQRILARLPRDFPVPITIAQHMPKAFTQSFAERLNRTTQLKVKEAENRESLEPGVALIAPGNAHMLVRRRGRQVVVELTDDQSYVYRPSVDLLFSTVAGVYGSKSIAVILTGMGTDGLNGAREIRKRSGYLIAQDGESSAVYGMPRAVAEARLTSSTVPVEKIAEEIMRAL